jgi:hypothetical protein
LQELRSLRRDFEDKRKELKELERRHDKLEGDFEESRLKYDKRLKDLENGNKKQLDLCIANGLIDLVENLRSNDKAPQGDEHSTHRSVQFAAKLDNSYLQKHGVPSKYWSYIGNLPKVYTKYVF